MLLTHGCQRFRVISGLKMAFICVIVEERKKALRIKTNKCSIQYKNIVIK